MTKCFDLSSTSQQSVRDLTGAVRVIKGVKTVVCLDGVLTVSFDEKRCSEARIIRVAASFGNTLSLRETPSQASLRETREQLKKQLAASRICLCFSFLLTVLVLYLKYYTLVPSLGMVWWLDLGDHAELNLAFQVGLVAAVCLLNIKPLFNGIAALFTLKINGGAVAALSCLASAAISVLSAVYGTDSYCLPATAVILLCLSFGEFLGTRVNRDYFISAADSDDGNAAELVSRFSAKNPLTPARDMRLTVLLLSALALAVLGAFITFFTSNSITNSLFTGLSLLAAACPPTAAVLNHLECLGALSSAVAPSPDCVHRPSWLALSLCYLFNLVAVAAQFIIADSLLLPFEAMLLIAVFASSVSLFVCSKALCR